MTFSKVSNCGTFVLDCNDDVFPIYLLSIYKNHIITSMLYLNNCFRFF